MDTLTTLERFGAPNISLTPNSQNQNQISSPQFPVPVIGQSSSPHSLASSIPSSNLTTLNDDTPTSFPVLATAFGTKSYLNSVYRNPYTFTLRAAVIEGNVLKVKKILNSHGLSLQSPNPENGWPLLFYAIQHGQNGLVKFMLDNGHENQGLSKDFRFNTALHIATEFKNEEAFRMYITLFPQTVRMVNKEGKSPLIIATLRGLNDVVCILLEMGADVNSADGDGSYPLHHAAAWGYYETVGLLMERGALYNVKNKNGWTPFDYAYTLDMREHLQECATAVADGRPIKPLVYQREQQFLAQQHQQMIQQQLMINTHSNISGGVQSPLVTNTSSRLDLRGLF
ncbi:hypothetical protein HK096_003201 [Nowakowskiella sp. JEL0078]|nr:hypothetical protein HK096_003201 [Nowakowskiella sp. JEL0078]